MKSRSVHIVIIAVLAVVFALLNGMMLVRYLNDTKHYPEFITAIGRLRAGMQRSAKLEMSGTRDDALLTAVDTLLETIASEKRSLGASNPAIDRHTTELKEAWERMRTAIHAFRESPTAANREALLRESESYTDAARGLSFEAQAMAENSRRTLVFSILLMAFNAAALSGAVIWIKIRVTDRLEHSATHDHLTGIYNRRIFEQFLENEIRICERQNREGYRSALILFDIDRFKSINDTEGHPAGDAVLKSIANTVRTRIRKGDVFGRFGGDEFVIISSGSDDKRALGLMEKLRKFIREIPAHEKVDVSAGVTELMPGDTPESALARVDKALYAAKEDGRGRTVRI
ncbi:MAG: GGDEF domain-containing protein [Spirochaetota bacterium]